jgi:sulfur-oxidizing protein SoxY
MDRRDALKASAGSVVMALAAASGLLKTGEAFADEWNKGAFDGKSLNEVVKAMGGSAATESKDVQFVNAPDIAENGAVVPIGATSKIPKTESI